MKKRALFTTVGITLFLLGMFAIVIRLVGVQIAFMTWMDAAGALIGFVAEVLMIVIGSALLTLAWGKWDDSDEADISIQ